MHPDTERLQGYADDSIPSGDRAVVASHLEACARCAAEVAEWRSLFATLSSLPRLAPRPGFADRVMAGVKLPGAVPVYAPWLERGRRLAERLTPTSTGGWALATAFVTLPLLVAGLLGYWVVANEYVTPAALWAFATERATSDLQGLGTSVLSTLIQSDLTVSGIRLMRRIIDTAGVSGLGALVLGVAFTTTLSIWVLYRNLFRTPTRESNHVSYSF